MGWIADNSIAPQIRQRRGGAAARHAGEVSRVGCGAFWWWRDAFKSSDKDQDQARRKRAGPAAADADDRARGGIRFAGGGERIGDDSAGGDSINPVRVFDGDPARLRGAGAAAQ